MGQPSCRPGLGARTVGLQPMQWSRPAQKPLQKNRRPGRLPDLRLERCPLPLRRYLTNQRPATRRMTIVRKTGALGAAGSATVAVGIVPAAVASAGETGRRAWLDFFAAQIRNRNTRQAYARAAHRLFDWLAEYGIHDVVDIEPVHIAVWLEERMREASRPTVKQELAGIRRLFDWLTVRQVVSSSPAAAVRGPKHTVRRGTTPVLSVAECRRFLRSIPVETIGGLRDRALIATMTYSFARVSAALAMNVKDVFMTDSRLWLRLLEKGGKVLEVPCHHNLETYLQDYIEVAGIDLDRDSPLFRLAQP